MNPALADFGVESIFQDYEDLVADLSATPSGLSALNRSYHKHLLIAAASSLEEEVKSLIPQLFSSRGGERIGAFVAKRVFSRGYHTLFDWDGGSAKGFFASFGEACGSNFKSALKSDPDLKDQHDAFIALGQSRNLLVHNDYAKALVELTPSEIMSKYELAIEFVARIESFIFVE